MKNIIFYILATAILCCTGTTGFAQDENIWVFGDSAGLDFRTNPPTAFRSSLYALEGSASVCDTRGRLLFYTNGVSVWDSTHNRMPNGYAIKQLIEPVTASGNVSTSQGVIIIPVPKSNTRYYIFSLTGYEYRTYNSVAEVGKLYYSIVDMSLNNGLGDVDVNHKGVLIDSGLTEQMTSVSGDECNTWLLVLSQSGMLKAYNVAPAGIDFNPVLSPVTATKPDPAITTQDEHIVGCMNLSPDRKKLAIARRSVHNTQKLVLYDFDPAAGRANNERLLDSSRIFYAMAFSSGNTKMYAIKETRSGEPGQVHQFDVSNGALSAILNSRQVVYDGRRAIFGIKRGPDGKMYIFVNGSNIMSVIQYPDLTGAACQYTDSALTLSNGTLSGIGFPNVISPPDRGLDTFINVLAQNTCFTDSALLTVSDNRSVAYEWSTGSGERSITVTETGTYWVRYKIFCDTYIDTFRVDIFNPALAIEVSCTNQQSGKARLAFTTATSSNHRAWWTDRNGNTLSVTDSVVNVPAGSYSLHLSSSSGCDTVIDFVIGEEKYKVSFSVSDSIVCTGDTIGFINTSHEHFTSFTWDFGDSGASSERNPAYVYAAPGQHWVTLAGQGSFCADTVRSVIIADAPLEHFLFLAERKDVCSGEMIHFYTHASDSTLLSFYWALGDNNHVSTTDTTVNHAYDKAGVFPVSITAQFRSCPDITLTDTVTVHPLPIINLGKDSVICLHGKPVVLQNQYPAEKDYRYLWSTGAAEESIIVTHHGEYWLQVSNAFSCTAKEHITIAKDCYIDIPNAFTPNNDGVNDYFFPRQLLSNSVKDFRMQIMTRWGQKIFETINTEGRGWDGKFNGREQPAGVYIYIIEIILNNGKEERLEGNVTLLR